MGCSPALITVIVPLGRAEDNDRLVASFSGGWQMRMCLGKLLLQEPDLLLLDEVRFLRSIDVRFLMTLLNSSLQPTNHLDIDAVAWLEGYLKTQAVPMVVVSHDREFLDQVMQLPATGTRSRHDLHPTLALARSAPKSWRQSVA